MGVLYPDGAKRLAKRLKRILQDEFGDETRLGHCQQAIAEGFDFANFSDMMHGLPSDTRWHPDWCINALYDDGHVRTEHDARQAVRRLEETLGLLIAGRPAGQAHVEPSGLRS